MTTAATASPAPEAPVQRAKPYGWDRTPYTRDPFSAMNDDGYAPDMVTPADDFTFDDFLSIFNPLQQLPVVSTVYRAETGKTIHPLARVLGGVLLGGPMGLVGAFLNNVLEKTTGKDVGDHVMAAVFPRKDAAPAQPSNVAAAQPTAADKPRKSLGERLAAVFLPDREATPDLPNVAAKNADRTLGQKLAAVDLPQTKPAAAKGRAPSPASDAAPVAAAPVQAASRNGRSLADYQARAIEAPSSTAIGRAMVRPQTPGLRVAPATASAVAAASPAPVAKTEAATETAAPAKLTDAPVNTWFAERMLMGLDLYRNAKRNEAKAQVDRFE
jgi:hypothetical protein